MFAADFLVNITLRSVGQVAFADNPASGLLILVALAIDPTASETVLPGLACVVLANIASLVLLKPESYGAIRHGLFGFNAFLIGQSLTFHGAASALTHVAAPLFGVLVQLFLAAALSGLKSPPFTLPFNVTATLFLWQYANINSDNSAEGGEDEGSGANVGYDPAWSDAHHALFRSFGQVFFASSTTSGFLIFLAVLLSSRASALAGSLGAGLCSLWSLAALPPQLAAGVPLGLAGYNGALTGIALGGVFLAPVNIPSLLAVVGACGLTGIFQTALWFEFGVGTMPFCFACIAVMSLKGKDGGGSSRVLFVRDDEIGSTPEVNFKRQIARRREAVEQAVRGMEGSTDSASGGKRDSARGGSERGGRGGRGGEGRGGRGGGGGTNGKTVVEENVEGDFGHFDYAADEESGGSGVEIQEQSRSRGKYERYQRFLKDMGKNLSTDNLRSTFLASAGVLGEAELEESQHFIEKNA